MSKAIFTIDMPKCCGECPMSATAVCRHWSMKEAKTFPKDCPLKEMPKCMEEKNYTEELFKLIAKNPDLPIVPMVDGEIVGDDCGRWLGAWGSSYIGEYILGEDQVHFRDDDDPSEVEKVLLEQHGYNYYSDTRDEYKVYAELPWIKAIIVNIDVPG